MAMMKAAIFVEPNRIVLDDKPIPEVGPLDALVRVTTTTICGTDVHILKGEYPVARGLTIGHEPVGVIENAIPKRLLFYWCPACNHRWIEEMPEYKPKPRPKPH